MSIELAPGAVIADRYRLERELGAGGMGEVWAATQTLTRKRVALKFLRTPDPWKKGSEASADRHRKRFVREARAACAVKHPNVVEVHDVLELDDGAPVIVMELLEGETLAARLARERLSLTEVCRVALRVVSAMGAAHDLGIVHRDLKPENIFLVNDPDGGSPDVKVLDFGIAKLTASEGDIAESAALTGTGALLGTPAYMAPEQAYGERDLDARADIWALGVILYQALTGVLPTLAENFGQILKIITQGKIKPIRALEPALPEDLAELVTRLLSVDREDRPASVRELRFVLERHASSSSVSGDALPSPAAIASITASSDLASGETLLAPSSDLVSGETLLAPATALGSSETVLAPATESATLDAHDVSTQRGRPTKNGRAGLVFAGVVAAGLLAGVVGWRITGASTGRSSSAPSSGASTALPPSVVSAPSVPSSSSALALSPSTSASAAASAPVLSTSPAPIGPKPGSRAPTTSAAPTSAPLPTVSVRVQRDF